MNPTLKDHNGVWCAECLDYIVAPDQKEEHHVYPTRFTRDLPAFSRILGDWTVPVHKTNTETGVQCHRSRMQPRSDAIAHPIVGFSTHSSTQNLITVAKDAWSTGHLKIAVAIHEHLRSLKELEGSQAEQNLAFMLASAGGATVSADVTQDLHKIAETMTRSKGKPENFLNSAIVYTCNGKFKEALRFIEYAKDALGKGTRNSPAFARRLLPFLRSQSAAKETVRLARNEEGAYQKRTALLLSAWTCIGLGNYSSALAQFHEVVVKITTAPISWWHRFESIFGSGCAEYLIEQKPTESSLGQLQAAQYILCCLGLKGLAIPDLRRPGSPLTAGVLPFDILTWIALSHPGNTMLTRSALFENRKEWIGDAIKADIFESQDLLFRGHRK